MKRSVSVPGFQTRFQPGNQADPVLQLLHVGVRHRDAVTNRGRKQLLPVKQTGPDGIAIDRRLTADDAGNHLVIKVFETLGLEIEDRTRLQSPVEQTGGSDQMQTPVGRLELVIPVEPGRGQ